MAPVAGFSQCSGVIEDWFWYARLGSEVERSSVGLEEVECDDLCYMHSLIEPMLR